MKKQRGFTLFEVLVSISLIGFVTAFLTPAFIATAKFNTSSELRSLAIDATDQKVDADRLTDPSTMQSTGTSTTNITIGGYAFAIRTDYCLTSSYCDTVTRHLTYTTTYKGTTYYATQTVFTQLQ